MSDPTSSSADPTAGDPAAPTDAPVPTVRVVSGDPTPEELAALFAVLAARGGGAPPTGTAPSTWGSPARAVRGPARPGANAWRTSALPR